MPVGLASLAGRLRLLAALRAAKASPALQRLAERDALGGGSTPKITTGAITGAVRGLRGQALPGACVKASRGSSAVMTLAGLDGRYTLNGLSPGRYVLSYRDCARPGRYFEQWSGGAAWPSLAKPVMVSAGDIRAVSAVRLRSTDPAALLPSRPRLSLARPRSGSGTASISGVVTGNGKPVRGICVQEDQLHNGYSIGFEVTTSRTGRYAFRKLARGRYQVTFAPILDCADPGNWLQQFYKGVTDVFPPSHQTTIKLRKGEHFRRVDARMKRGSQISGRVTSRSGHGLRGICVNVAGRVRGGFIFTAFATDGHGRYAWQAVFPGKYTVSFTSGCGNKGNFAPQWWPHSATQSQAKPVRVRGSRLRTHIDAVLQPGAVITGRVTVKRTSRGIGGICVDATNSDGTIDSQATTRRDGRYRIRRLGTGRYLVQFDPTCNNLNLVGTQRFVKVQDGKTTDLDVALQPAAGISGRVHDIHGRPLDGICVTIQDNAEGPDEIKTSNGSYSVLGLIPRQTATVEFAGGCGNKGSFAPQFYHGRTLAALADPISLKPGKVARGIDATMEPGGSITGIVTNAAGHRLSNVCVVLSAGNQNPPLYDTDFADFLTTRNGRYSDQNLAPGPYDVDFGCGDPRFADQSFRAQPTPEAADVVSVPAGAVTSGINAALRRAGTIAGVVRNKSGHPLSNICATAIDQADRTNQNLFNGADVTGSSGDYVLSGLTPGIYDVLFSECFSPGKYGNQWYSHKRTQAAATPVRVRAGRTTTGIDADMTTGGFIHGRIVNRAGRPLNNICAIAIDQTTGSIAGGITGRHGNYTIEALSTGSYALSFQPCGNQNLATVFRKGKVRVTAPQAVRGINATLLRGGTIVGTVSFGTGSPRPLSNACVEVISPRNAMEAAAFTGPDGRYIIDGLATGRYRVLFGSPGCIGNMGLMPQWFSGKSTEQSANLVQVTQGTTIVDIDAKLRLGGLGSISGHVIRSGGPAVRGECVTALPTGRSNPTFGPIQPEIGVTSGNGSYSLTDLVPGRYKVRFDVGCGATGLATQWWSAASSFATATVITVTADARVTGINAALRR